MKISEKKNLVNVKGGGVSPWLVAGISALVTFVSGILDGIARPRRCN